MNGAANSLAAAAVAIGPRKKRWLAAGMAALAAIGAIVATVLLTRSPNDASRATPSRARANAHLVFGMTTHQVERRTGPPATTRGNCWLFRPTKTGMVGSISVQPSFAKLPYDPRTTGDLKLCFLGGVYSSSELRVFDKRERKWVWGAWPLALWSGAPQ